MPTVNPSPLGVKPQYELSNGQPAVGNQLFWYVSGSSTKQNTYTDSTGGVANSNPLVLNSLGMPTTEIWLQAGLTYRLVYAPANDTDPPSSPIYTIDGLLGINDTSVGQDQWVASGLTPTYIGATSFSLAGDQTTAFHIGRRLKTINSGGTIYSRISNSVFGALTTVTVVNDSGVLDAGLSAVSYGLLTATNPSIPKASVTLGDVTLDDLTLSGGDVTYTAVTQIKANTSNGADTSSIAINGGGGAGEDSGRGAYLKLCGNENAGNGTAFLVAGSSGNAGFLNGSLQARLTSSAFEINDCPLDLTNTCGQVIFPATQNPSANANTLDDYQEYTYTPVLTFATPGNQSIILSTAAASGTKIGKRVNESVTAITSTFTHTTAAGDLQITGSPYTSLTSSAINEGHATVGGYTKANYTSISLRRASNTAIYNFGASGSAVAASTLAFGDMPTGGSVTIRASCSFIASA